MKMPVQETEKRPGKRKCRYGNRKKSLKNLFILFLLVSLEFVILDIVGKREEDFI